MTVNGTPEKNKLKGTEAAVVGGEAKKYIRGKYMLTHCSIHCPVCSESCVRYQLAVQSLLSS